MPKAPAAKPYRATISLPPDETGLLIALQGSMAEREGKPVAVNDVLRAGLRCLAAKEKIKL